MDVQILEQRINARLLRRPGGCLEWQGSRTTAGYGQMWDGSRVAMVHRMSYELAKGPIPEGLDLDHLCRNRLCANPAHLEPVTRRENIMRGVAPGKVAARHKAQTHCKNGHEFTPANTYAYVRRGWIMRHCRECQRIRGREYLERKRHG